MTSTSDSNLIILLQSVSFGINCYFGIFIFLVGITGNILNILTLSQKNLRSNPCGWFFLMSSITSIVAFCSGLSTRIVIPWNLDFSTTNQGLCKFRSIISYTSLTATTWFIASATIDRWLSSSTIIARRQKSTIKNAYIGTIIIICVTFSIHIQVLVCFEANLRDAPQKCFGKSPECRLISDLSFVIITVLLPLIIMIIFGLLTVAHVRQSRHRIHNANKDSSNEAKSIAFTQQQHQYKKIDRQLLIMLLFQVSILIILFFPVPIFRLYLTFTSNISKSTSQKNIEDLTYNLFLLLLFLANGLSFYIYTLSGGNVFRKALKSVFTFIY